MQVQGGGGDGGGGEGDGGGGDGDGGGGDGDGGGGLGDGGGGDGDGGEGDCGGGEGDGGGGDGVGGGGDGDGGGGLGERGGGEGAEQPVSIVVTVQPLGTRATEQRGPLSSSSSLMMETGWNRMLPTLTNSDGFKVTTVSCRGSSSTPLKGGSSSNKGVLLIRG